MRIALASPGWRNVLFAAALSVALLFGGGGAEGSAQNGVIAALGAILLCTIFADQVTGARPLPSSAILPVLILAIFLGIALLQIVPIAGWQGLPGRDVVLAALEQVGASQRARAVSIDPAATAVWTTALLMPAAVFLHVVRAPSQTVRMLLLVLIGCSFVSGLVGAMQLAFGHPELLTFYEGPSHGAASGVFANPNHQGLMMVLASIAVTGLVLSPARGSGRGFIESVFQWAMVAFFAMMAIASGSRAALMLLALSLPITLLLLLRSISVARWVAAFGVAVGLIWALILLYPGTNTLAIRESFRLSEESRTAFYPDLLFTFWQYWPVGSGLGTFTTAFLPNENLDIATRAYLNHAHNDFLELFIEAGALGAAALVVATALVCIIALNRLRKGAGDQRLLIGACMIVVACWLHSIGDYPLRTSSIAAAFAVALGIIFRPSQIGGAAARRAFAPWLHALLVLASVPIGLQALRLNLIAADLRAGREDWAARLGSRDAQVLTAQARSLLRQGKINDAEGLAAEAVTRSPLDPTTLSTLAQVRDARGGPSEGAWQTAALLGWREPATQFWAVQRAFRTGQPEIAALRTDALLRTSEPPAEFLRLARAAAAQDAKYRAALVDRLKLEPAWSRNYYAVTSKASPIEIEGVLATLSQQASSGAAVELADTRSLIATLVATQNYDQAARVYRLAGGRFDRDRLLADEHFDRQPADYRESTMFDWRLLGGRSASVSIDAASPGLLVIDSDGDRVETAADVHFPLPAGTYEVAYRWRSEGSDSVLLRISCLTKPSPIAEAPVTRSASFTTAEVSFSVSHPCPMARLSVQTGVTDHPLLTEFDFISVRRLGD